MDLTFPQGKQTFSLCDNVNSSKSCGEDEAGRGVGKGTRGGAFMDRAVIPVSEDAVQGGLATHCT